MAYRTVSLALMSLAALAFAASVRAESEKVHEGHTVQGPVVKVEGNKLTMAGKNKKEQAHDIAKEAAITFNGKKAKLEDLKAHNYVVVTMDDKHAATKVDAYSMGMDGHVVKVEGSKLTMVGEDKKEHAHDVTKDAEVMIDGKKAKLEDLKPHTHVVALMDDKHAVLKVVGHTHKEKK